MHRDGRFLVGDELVNINGASLRGLKMDQVGQTDTKACREVFLKRMQLEFGLCLNRGGGWDLLRGRSIILYPAISIII